MEMDGKQGQRNRRHSHPQLVSSPTTGSRLLGIEGLRGVAAVSVLIAHAHVHLGATADLGVFRSLVDVLGQGLTLFFALSGFLLYRPFVAHWLEGKPYPNARQFLSNRALRIYPAYIVILLIVCLVLGVAYTESIPPGKDVQTAESTVGYMTNPLLIFLNITLLHTLFPVSIKTGLGVSWSLTVEVMFYLFLPVLGLLLLKLKKRRVAGGSNAKVVFLPPFILLVIGLLGKAIVGLITRGEDPANEFYLNWGGNWVAVFSRSLLVHADLFSFGMMAAILIGWERSGRMSIRSRKALIWSAAIILPVSVGAAKVTTLDDTLFALAAAAVIVLVCIRTTRGTPNFLSRFMELLPLRFTGLVSYSLYLWHIPVIWFLSRHNLVLAEEQLGANVALVFVVSLALSTITYYLVEVPALRLKKSADGKKSAERPSESLESVASPKGR